VKDFYRAVHNFPKYRVGRDGSVWSFRCLKWKRLKCRSVGSYLQVTLRCRYSSRVRQAYVHSLILETFVGPCPSGMESCHWDDEGLNNSVDNLRWGTRKENTQDAIRNGRFGFLRKRGRRPKRVLHSAVVGVPAKDPVKAKGMRRPWSLQGAIRAWRRKIRRLPDWDAALRRGYV
jgi:hypothetical protein